MTFNRLPILVGLLTVLTLGSSLMLVYRLVGLDRGTAFYLACLTVALVIHLASRRMLRRTTQK